MRSMARGFFVPQAPAMLFRIGTQSAHPRPPWLWARADAPRRNPLDFRSVSVDTEPDRLRPVRRGGSLYASVWEVRL